MPASLRTPSALHQPDRDGYSDTYEETRSRVEMDTGPARVRNKTRSAPRIFSVTWRLTNDLYSVFDRWWENDLKGGSLDFDTQLIDADETLTWFTLRVLDGVYRAQVIGDGQGWLVTTTVRALGPSFLYRPSGTDELESNAVYQYNAPGELFVPKVLRGIRDVEFTGSGTLAFLPLRSFRDSQFTGSGRLLARPLFSDTRYEFTNTGQLEQLGDPALILKFDAVTYTPDNGGTVELKFDADVYYPPRIS